MKKSPYKVSIMPVLLFVCLMLYGCPYESRTPLGAVDNASIDTALPGIWLCTSIDGKDRWQFRFYAFDEWQYYITAVAEGEEPTHFRAYSTMIKGMPFLNVQELEFKRPAEKRTFWFMRYGFGKDSSLEFKFLKHQALRDLDVNGSAVRAYIEKNIDSTDLYEDYCVCNRNISQDISK